MKPWNVLLIFISVLMPTLALAEGQSTAQPATWEMLVMPAGFLAIMYFFMIRPQQKRAKDHKEFLTSLKSGDEVITTGGIIGRVKTVQEKFVSIEIAANTVIKVIKSEISASALKAQSATQEKA